MKKGRLHLRLDEDLLQATQAYARTRHTTLSELIRQHFLNLLEEEKRGRDLDAPQI
jgi:hypothetical protein